MFCPWRSSVVADSSPSVITQLWNALYSDISVRGVACGFSPAVHSGKCVQISRSILSLMSQQIILLDIHKINGVFQ